MCGRYALFTEDHDDRMQQMIRLCNDAAEDSQQISNQRDISPGAHAPAIICVSRKAMAVSMQWGFEREGGLLIHARSEDAAERSTFRGLLQAQRCVLPAAGYYEWRDRDHLRHIVTPSGHDALYLTGLYRSDALGHFHFVILTRNAYGPHAGIHGRMPCMLFSREDARRWISGVMPLEALRKDECEALDITAQGFEQLCMDFDD